MSDGRITHVTLLEDRAQVRRTLQVALTAGTQRLRIDGVSPVLYDRSLAVKLGSDQGPTIKVLDARAQRRWSIGAAEAPAPVRALLAEEADLGLQKQRWTEALGRARVEAQLVQQALDLTFEGGNRELAFAVATPESLQHYVPVLFERERKLDADIAEANAKMRACDEKLATLQAHKSAMAAPFYALSNSIVIDVEAAEAADATVLVEYLVPCAAWRPMHRATLKDDKLRFSCDAAVWQATGEDWTDVALAFSTARSTARGEPPLLEDDHF